MTETGITDVHFFSDTFAELEPAERMTLLDHAQERDFEDKETIIRQGADNRNIYVVLEGEVQVELEPTENRPESQILSRLDLGSIFGEMTFLTHAGASANVVASGPVKLLCMDHAHLHQMVSQDPGFGSRFYRALAVTLAERLRESSRKH